MFKALVLCSLLLAPVISQFSSSSSSESCEDDRGFGGGGRPGGGRPGGGRPGNGGGGPNGGCESGWRRFNRPSGGWCIRVFGGRINRPTAETQCRSQGATLSGVQNLEETKYITSQALRVVTSQTSTSVWIGAVRTAACNKQGLTASCTPQNSFRWTDGSTTGIAGFIWEYGQPDNAHSRTQNCVVALASPSSVRVGTQTWQPNNLDDTDCSLISPTTPHPRAVLAYACGKRPTS